MSEVFERFEVADLRFPTSAELDGSDAMNPDPDYSLAYLTVRTSDQDAGHGFVFTIGRGTEIQVAAIEAIEPLVAGLDVEATLADLGGFARRLVHDSQLRWLGPESGVVHMAIGAVVNAVWDLAARRSGKPLWKLLVDMSPEQLVGLVDFRHLTDALSPAEALELFTAGRQGREDRELALLRDGLPAYTTSAGWLGYSDEKVTRLVREALAGGFRHVKLKVGGDREADERRVAMVRRLIGPDVLLSVDANQRWEVDEAIDRIGRLAGHGLHWAEEPVSAADILGHRRVARAVAPVLVATGEHVANRVVFKQLLASGAIGVCQIDACRVAGVNENLAIMLLAAKYGIPVCPHAGGVGLCELVQHLAMFDHVALGGEHPGRWIEYVDHLHQHFADPVRVLGGRYQAPLAAGFSAELRPETLEEFRHVDGGQSIALDEREVTVFNWFRTAAVCLLIAAGVAACGSSSSSSGGSGSSGAGSSGSSSSKGPVTIGVDLTYNNTDFWSSYISYEKQYAQQMGIKLLGPDLAGANASTQNQQIQELVNEGAKAIIVNPETATSLGPAISYAASKGVKLVSVDTIVGVGKVYMVVRASNLLYGEDACAEISSKVRSGYVLDLEGDLTSSNGADRTNAFDSCMKANDPAVHVLASPTTWVDGTAVTDAQNAINAHGSQLKAIYSQWSSPDTGIVPILQRKGLHPLLVSDDGVPFEMCDIGKGTVTGSQSQPATLYAKYALTYAKDAAQGVALKPGMKGGGAPKLQNVSYKGDTNLADPIVAPFVTKSPVTLTVAHPVDGLPGTLKTTPVSTKSLWGNQYGASHGGVCSAS